MVRTNNSWNLKMVWQGLLDAILAASDRAHMWLFKKCAVLSGYTHVHTCARTYLSTYPTRPCGYPQKDHFLLLSYAPKYMCVACCCDGASLWPVTPCQHKCNYSLGILAAAPTTQSATKDEYTDTSCMYTTGSIHLQWSHNPWPFLYDSL